MNQHIDLHFELTQRPETGRPIVIFVTSGTFGEDVSKTTPLRCDAWGTANLRGKSEKQLPSPRCFPGRPFAGLVKAWSAHVDVLLCKECAEAGISARGVISGPSHSLASRFLVHTYSRRRPKDPHWMALPRGRPAPCPSTQTSHRQRPVGEGQTCGVCSTMSGALLVRASRQ